MKKYFWAKHIEAKKIKKHTEAERWKAMALKKAGDTITIEQRQFIGSHPEVQKAIEKIVSQNFSEALKKLLPNH